VKPPAGPVAVRERFQFVILADRAGGHRAAVFEKAVAGANLLAPELVMCVGDLIEGVTDNVASIGRQWDEAERILAGLKAPFHYVAGNHDFANKVMAEIWRKRHGPDYYSFLHEGALFIVLNSEAEGAGKLGDGQLSWLEKTLADNRGVRWTFVFLHKPLWARGEGKGWDRVEALLRGRPCTVFAGHTHHYTAYDRGQSRYFVLATTGGIGEMRGPAFGEFDEVALVTMTKAGPVVANLLVDGILPPDVMTEKMAALREPLERGIPVQATNNTGQDIRAGAQFRLKCSNSAGIPLSVKLTPRPPAPFTANPASVRLSVNPNTSRDFRFALSLGPGWPMKEPISLERAVQVEWTLAYEPDRGRQMENRGVTDVHFDRRSEIIKVGKMAIDGRLNDWPRLPEACEDATREQIHPDLWKGLDDCSFRFGVAEDDKNLYVAVDVNDDQMEVADGWNPWDQDGLAVVVDARPEKARDAKPKGDGTMSFFLSPGDTREKTNFYDAASYPKGIVAVCIKKKRGHVTELAVPLAVLKEKAGWDGGSIRVNVCVYDFDTETIRMGMEGYGTYMWWRPDWESIRSWPGSGTFGDTSKP